MGKIMINNTTNKQIKNLIQLQKKHRVREEQGAFVVEGMKMFEEAKAHGIMKAYASETFCEEQFGKNELLFEGIPLEIVSDHVLREVADTITPQGIVAVVRKPVYQMETILEREEYGVLLLEDIRDPGNLGTIIRTAEAAGIAAVIMSRETVDIFNPKVIRATMGSIYRVPFFYVDNLQETIWELKKNHTYIYAAYLNGSRCYDEICYPDRTGFLIGNEARGLSRAVVELADSCIQIPMCGKVESLNAGVAAAVLMYEFSRQKRNQNPIDSH